MKVLAVLATVAALASCAPSVPVDDNRVIGGQVAKDGQFPYQVSIQVRGEHNCGGSIIDKEWILTAAHCVYGLNEAMVVVVGTNTLNAGGLGYRVTQGFYHGSYDQTTMKNDIALLKVEPIQFNSRVKVVGLQTSDVGAGVPMTLSGWGLTQYPGSTPNNMMFAVLTSISNADCGSKLKQVISAGQVCTYTKLGQGSCQGDSGGPLVSGGLLSGVVSFGMPCAIGLPDVYTRVSYYRSWIQSIMANN